MSETCKIGCGCAKEEIVTVTCRVCNAYHLSIRVINLEEIASGAWGTIKCANCKTSLNNVIKDEQTFREKMEKANTKAKEASVGSSN